MKRDIIGFFFGFLSLPVLFFFMYQRVDLNPAIVQLYPENFGSIPCEVLLKTATKIPEPLLQEVTRWISQHENLVSKLLTIPTFTSIDAFKQFNKSVCAQAKDINLSRHNFIFDINSQDNPAVIKIAGFPSRISSMVSTLGYDPYSYKWHTRSDLIYKATRATIPTQQHISRAATQMLLNNVNSDFIAPIHTYLYHIPGRPETCDDRNYIIVQEKLAGFYPLSSFDTTAKQLFLSTIPLQELYQAIKYANLWDISEDNIWVAKNMDKIAYPDGEKPNNEGYGKSARWKVAILGHDLDKLKYNIRNWYDGGHRKFEEILKNYAPERIEQWNKLYTNDPEVH